MPLYGPGLALSTVDLDIQALGAAPSAGASLKAASATHVHPTSGLIGNPYAGRFTVTGGAAGFEFIDRTSLRGWQWYGSGDLARLWTGAGDALVINPSAAFTLHQFGLTGPFFSAPGARATNVHTVHGATVLDGTGSVVVTLAGAAVFSAQTSYMVLATVSNVVGPSTVGIIRISGSQFQIYGPASAQVDFLAFGN
jgi:hypothetical protein